MVPPYTQSFRNLVVFANANTVLLGGDRMAARGTVATNTVAEHGSETNLVVDLLHTLEIGLGGALGSKNDVLKMLVKCMHHLPSNHGPARGHDEVAQLTISSSVSLFVSGTRNQTKAAPR